jgi:hypothetical protein
MDSDKKEKSIIISDNCLLARNISSSQFVIPNLDVDQSSDSL